MRTGSAPAAVRTAMVTTTAQVVVTSPCSLPRPRGSIRPPNPNTSRGLVAERARARRSHSARRVRCVPSRRWRRRVPRHWGSATPRHWGSATPRHWGSATPPKMRRSRPATRASAPGRSNSCSRHPRQPPARRLQDELRASVVRTPSVCLRDTATPHTRPRPRTPPRGRQAAASRRVRRSARAVPGPFAESSRRELSPLASGAR